MISNFPAFTLVLIPTAANSEIIGPGAKLVGPALITISLGAAWPALAGASDLFFTIRELREKGFSLVKIRAGIPLIFSLNLLRCCFFDFERARYNNFFLAMLILMCFDLSMERML